MKWGQNWVAAKHPLETEKEDKTNWKREDGKWHKRRDKEAKLTREYRNHNSNTKHAKIKGFNRSLDVLKKHIKEDKRKSS